MSAQNVPCDLCGSEARVSLFEIGRNAETVINNVCEKCGLVYISPRPEPSDIAERYSTGAFSIDARGSEKPTKEKINAVEKLAIERYRRLTTRYPIITSEPGNALEIGCGIGSFLRLVRGLGWQVDGLEPDPGYAQAGKEEYGLSITPQVYEQEALHEAKYDLIASFHVLEHVNSPTVFLQKAFSELKPGGLLYLEVPTIDKPYGGNLEFFFWSAHLYSFSRSTLKALLRKVGFTVEHAGYQGDYLEIYARKSEKTDTTIHFPVDPPAEVVRKTHAAYRRYQVLSRFPLIPNVPGYLKKIAAVYRDDPSKLRALVAMRVKRKLLPLEQKAFVSNAKRALRGPFVVHYGMHVVSNAGDVMLFDAVRAVFNEQMNVRSWSKEPVWNEVTLSDVQRINRNARGVVIGGGGLLLKDTNANANSGWQWNCPTDLIEQFEVPIVVFAIGYNRFRTQTDFDGPFRENINRLVQKSGFFGMRNKGSIESLKEYLEPENQSKLVFQPCPTTVISRVYKGYPSSIGNMKLKALALNIAFDRQSLRFAGRENEILDAVAQAMRYASDHGWEIKLVVNVPDDIHVLPWLQKHKVPFEVVKLDGKLPSQILEFYSSVPLTIGMRGHSQMIPFGLGNAIISLVSHDKLRYFLDDIGHPEWGIEIHDPKLRDNLITAIQRIGDDRLMIRSALEESQDRLWDVTRNNMKSIREAAF